MTRKFTSHVHVPRSFSDYVHFAPGDEVPDWVLESDPPVVGDHVMTPAEDSDDEPLRVDRPELPDPKDLGDGSDEGSNEDSDDDSTEPVDYSTLTKDELIEELKARHLDWHGNKDALIERLEEDDRPEQE